MRSHQTTIHPRSPGSLVTGSPDHRPMEPQVTGLPWSLGHWVIGLLGHSKLIHPSITTIGSIHPRVRVTWLAIHPRVMTTKPLIHPSIQTRVKWLPIYPGSQGQGLHPSIHPGSWLPEPSIQTIEPFIHPVTRGRVRVSIQTMTTCSPSIQGVRVIGHRSRSGLRSQTTSHPSIQPGSGSQGIRPSKVTGHKTTDPQSHRSPGSLVTGLPIHPRPRSHLSIQTPGSWSNGYPSIQGHRGQGHKP